VLVCVGRRRRNGDERCPRKTEKFYVYTVMRKRVRIRMSALIWGCIWAHIRPLRDTVRIQGAGAPGEPDAARFAILVKAGGRAFGHFKVPGACEKGSSGRLVLLGVVRVRVVSFDLTSPSDRLFGPTLSPNRIGCSIGTDGLLVAGLAREGRVPPGPIGTGHERGDPDCFSETDQRTRRHSQGNDAGKVRVSIAARDDRRRGHLSEKHTRSGPVCSSPVQKDAQRSEQAQAGAVGEKAREKTHTSAPHEAHGWRPKS